MRTSALERPDAPLATAPFSTSTTFTPFSASAYAMLVPLTPPPMTTTSAVCAMVLFRLRGERGQRHGLGGRTRREDTRLGHRLSRLALDEMRERWAAHAPLTAPHADPRPRLHLVDVARSLARRPERFADRHFLAAAERGVVVGQRVDPRSEAIHLVHDLPESSEVKEPAARAARLARVFAPQQTLATAGHDEPRETSLFEGDGRAGHAGSVAYDEHVRHRALELTRPDRHVATEPDVVAMLAAGES